MTTKKRKGGELLGFGSYGCAFANPRLLCKKDKYPQQGTVSKLMITKNAMSELQSNFVIDQLDKEYIYHIKTFGTCNKFNKKNKQITTECQRFITNDSSLLITEYGGKEVSKQFPIEHVHNFWFNATRLLIGLHDFISHGYAYLDIRPPNVLYVLPTKDDHIGKINFIDFGTFRKKENFLHADAFFTFYGYLSPICAFLDQSRLNRYLESSRNKTKHQELKNNIIDTLTGTANSISVSHAREWYQKEFPSDHYNYLSKLINMKPYHAHGLTSVADIWKHALHVFFNSMDEYIKDKDRHNLYNDFIKRADIFGVGFTLYFALMNFKQQGFGNHSDTRMFAEELEELFTNMTHLELQKQDTNVDSILTKYIHILERHCQFPSPLPSWYTKRFGSPASIITQKRNQPSPQIINNPVNKEILNVPTPPAKVLSLLKSLSKTKSKQTHSLSKTKLTTLLEQLHQQSKHFIYYFYLLSRYPTTCIFKSIQLRNNETHFQEASFFFINCILQTNSAVSFFPLYLLHDHQPPSFHLIVFKKKFSVLEHYQPFSPLDQNNDSLMEQFITSVNNLLYDSKYSLFHVHRQQHCLFSQQPQTKKKLSKSVSLKSPLHQTTTVHDQTCYAYLFFVLEFSILNPENSLPELLTATQVNTSTTMLLEQIEYLLTSFEVFANGRFIRYLHIFDLFHINTIEGNQLLQKIITIELQSFNQEKIPKSKINDKIISILYNV